MDTTSLSIMMPIPAYLNGQSDSLERVECQQAPDKQPEPASLDEQVIGGEIWMEIGGERLALMAVLESLLFVADTPVEPAQIAKILNFDKRTIENGLQRLAQSYETAKRGLRI